MLPEVSRLACGRRSLSVFRRLMGSLSPMPRQQDPANERFPITGAGNPHPHPHDRYGYLQYRRYHSDYRYDVPSPSPASSPAPGLRLSLISRHLAPVYPINTPWTVERLPDIIDTTLLPKRQSRTLSTSTSSSNLESPKMPSSQPPHATLLIPGPIEFDDAVLQSMSHYSESHVGPGFVAVFGEALTMLRKLFQTSDPAAQPFILSGSGTLGWDLVAANLIEPGEDVLVLGTGYFSDGFADCLRVYGANVTELKAPVGTRPTLPEIEKALGEKRYKAITITHVDTSTGVLSDIKEVAALVRRVSPETLVVVDGVCSVGCEEIRFDEWDLDAVVTASQKAIGCPAGLSISIFSGRAMKAFQNRKAPVAAYFASMKNWTPIMQNYEAKKPSYFATPSPQLIRALHTALSQILARPLEERFAGHKATSDRIKSRIAELGLKQVAPNPAEQAHGMTAIYMPEGIQPAQILPILAKKGVVFAGGIHKEIASKYIRFGHMGVSALDAERGDVDKALKALEEALEEVGYKKP